MIIPKCNDTYNQLETLLLSIKQRDCVVLMGDFNSRLARNTDRRVGKWSIHKHSDEGGERLLNIMNHISLRCVSTYFRPRRNHNNATFMNVQPDKPPSQIDHILVSSRWASSVRNCKVQWGIAIAAYGRKYDHGLVKMDFKIRLRKRAAAKRRDFTALKEQGICDAHEASIAASLSAEERKQDVNSLWSRYKNTLQKAQTVIPVKSKPNRKRWETSEMTKSLVKQRSEKWDKLDTNGKKKVNKKALDRPEMIIEPM